MTTDSPAGVVDPPKLEVSGPLPSRSYVLLISGTMNPPHIGHVHLGLHAAGALRDKGHTVTAICFAPVHDNYLFNKVSMTHKDTPDSISPDKMCFSMSERCDMLRGLLGTEASTDKSICHVLDYEHVHGSSLLEESPNYWATRLPEGYLKTVPTAALMTHFASHSPLITANSRLGIVFGVDNLAGIVTWNRPGSLLARADLVFVSRNMATVKLPKSPSELLEVLRYFELHASVPVNYHGATLFGDKSGSFIHKEASGEGALFLLPPLQGGDEHLSSTSIRTNVAACMSTLIAHGFSCNELMGNLMQHPKMAGAVLTKIRNCAQDRGEGIGELGEDRGRDCKRARSDVW